MTGANWQTWHLTQTANSQNSLPQTLRNAWVARALSGAFKLFRNPSAHSVVGYDNAEGKSIVALVNLLIILLDKVEEQPPANLLPKNADQVIAEVEKTLGAGVTGRLRTFVSKCVKLGLEPDPKTKQWIPFKRHALMKYDGWEKPKPHRLPMFYLVLEEKGQVIQFPVHQYYRLVMGFDLGAFQTELLGLGFHPVGQQKYYTMDLRLHNDAAFFDKLADLVLKTREQIDRTLA